MAKSKNGGTRALIRGRVGSDVYSIGKDAKGSKQQVVRSLAESVSNPQTIAQMRGRMIMSTVMQFIATAKGIVDHSFDNVTTGQPSISECIRQNYALIKADVAANPSSGNQFGLVLYGEKGAKQGAYIVANGAAKVPSAIDLERVNAKVTIVVPESNFTMGGLKATLGMTNNDFFTICGIGSDGNFHYARFNFNKAIADSVAITEENMQSLFEIEASDVPSIQLAGNAINLILTQAAGNVAVIVSFKTGSGYIHNKAVLTAPENPLYTADVALPTYPIGEQRFLNGGDLAGTTKVSNNAGSISTQDAVVSVSVEGGASNGTATANPSSGLKVGDNVTLTCTPASGREFDYWKKEGESASFSTNNPLTVSLQGDVSFVAVTKSASSGGGSPLPDSDGEG